MKKMFYVRYLAAGLIATCLFSSSAVLGKGNDSNIASPLSVSAQDALERLKKGNQRFLSGRVRADGQSLKDVERLSKKQNPHSIVLSCSDSRVPPEIVFDQKLGEIFTVRSAGETLSPTTIASIEYAIANLGTNLIVVLGHTNCGAVKAAIDTIGGKSAGSANLDQLVADIYPRIKSKFDEKNPSKDLRAESWLNARGVAKDLLSRSPLIAKAVSSGKAKIRVGLYDLSSGAVDFE
jgi:carbonic anhydrase